MSFTETRNSGKQADLGDGNQETWLNLRYARGDMIQLGIAFASLEIFGLETCLWESSAYTWPWDGGRSGGKTAQSLGELAVGKMGTSSSDSYYFSEIRIKIICWEWHGREETGGLRRGETVWTIYVWCCILYNIFRCLFWNRVLCYSRSSLLW